MLENNCMKEKLSLLEAIAIRFRCDDLSDLKHLDHSQRIQLAQEIQGLSAKDEALWEWNEALEYFTGEKSHCSRAEQSKTTLITALTT